MLSGFKFQPRTFVAILSPKSIPSGCSCTYTRARGRGQERGRPTSRLGLCVRRWNVGSSRGTWAPTGRVGTGAEFCLQFSSAFVKGEGWTYTREGCFMFKILKSIYSLLISAVWNELLILWFGSDNPLLELSFYLEK